MGSCQIHSGRYKFFNHLIFSQSSNFIIGSVVSLEATAHFSFWRKFLQLFFQGKTVMAGAGRGGTSSAHNLTAQVLFTEITINLNMPQKCFWHILSGLKGQDLTVSSRFILIKSGIIFFTANVRLGRTQCPAQGGVAA